VAHMLHEIRISATPERVFEAISTRDGLRSWWTPDVEAEPAAGSVAQLGFDDRAVVFHMEVSTLEPPRRMEWRCIGGPGAWPRTRLSFELEPAREGATVLRFRHDGWGDTGGEFARCNCTWGALMHRLRDHVEGLEHGPLFAR